MTTARVARIAALLVLAGTATGVLVGAWHERRITRTLRAAS